MEVKGEVFIMITPVEKGGITFGERDGLVYTGHCGALTF